MTIKTIIIQDAKKTIYKEYHRKQLKTAEELFRDLAGCRQVYCVALCNDKGETIKQYNKA